MTVGLVDDAAVPVTSLEEAWKYTPTDEIVRRLAGAVPAGARHDQRGDATLTRADVDRLAGDLGGPRLVFVNGHFRAELSDLPDRPELRCEILRARVGTASAPSAELAAVAGVPLDSGMDAGDTAEITIESGRRIDDPVHLVHVAAAQAAVGGGTVSSARAVIRIGAHGALTVVETYCGLGGPTVTNAATSIRVDESGELDHHRIQIEARSATHLGDTSIELAGGARLRMSSTTLGADIARNAVAVRLDAPDARAELSGVAITTGAQRHDTVVTVDHAAPQCASSQRFTGVAGDRGRGSFSGEIVVRPGAGGTDAHQTSRNLILDPHAEADARPWLRIHADDVRCTHGAAVGRLDDDALFYLRSRGIGLAAARAMLIDAFIHESTEAIAHDGVHAHVARLLAAASSVTATRDGEGPS